MLASGGDDATVEATNEATTSSDDTVATAEALEAPAPEPVLTESCDGARSTPSEAARALTCARWKIELREGGTAWGYITAESYDDAIAERERHLGFARQYARFFEVPVDERYADPSAPICDTCSRAAPPGRWGDGQKFGGSTAVQAIDAAEADLQALDDALDKRVPELAEIARLSRETEVSKAAKTHAKNLRLAMLDVAKARLALDNANVFRSEKAAKEVSAMAKQRTEALAASYGKLTESVGAAVAKAHEGKYFEDNTAEPNRPYLLVEFNGSKVTGTYVVGAAKSTWFNGEVTLDGAITGTSLVAPENGTLKCTAHSEECGYVNAPAVLRFSERKTPDERVQEAAELWFQQSQWVLARPFSR